MPRTRKESHKIAQIGEVGLEIGQIHLHKYLFKKIEFPSHEFLKYPKNITNLFQNIFERLG